MSDLAHQVREVAYQVCEFTYSIFEVIYKMSVLENKPCEVEYRVRKVAYSVFEVFYKMSVLENGVSEDKYSVNYLAHRVREVARSVFEVIYKMSVLENTPCEVKYRVREVAHSVFEVVYKMNVLENRIGKELLSMRLIQRGADGESAAIQDVGVDLSGFDIFVAQEFCPCPTPPRGVGGPPGVNRSNVVTRFEQMGGKGVAQSMGTSRFSKADALCSDANGFLEGAFVQVVAS